MAKKTNSNNAEIISNEYQLTEKELHIIDSNKNSTLAELLTLGISNDAYSLLLNKQQDINENAETDVLKVITPKPVIDAEIEVLKPKIASSINNNSSGVINTIAGKIPVTSNMLKRMFKLGLVK